MNDRGWKGCYRVFMRVSGLAIASCAITSEIAKAQIIPDTSLGSESSTLRSETVNGLPRDTIEGGALRGANLFHSFQEFNVNEGQGVYFTNPTGVERIFSRVTGSNRSDIMGQLGVLGNADLFFLNPNGILFGPNASLDLKGSFIASTADRITFSDGTAFSAIAPQSPLLTINPPIALQFGPNPSPLINQSQASPPSPETPKGATNSIGMPVGLQVPNGKTLGLIGGSVTLTNGNLTALGGRIELGGVAGGTVHLDPVEKGWRLGYRDVQTFRDVSLLQESIVDATQGGDIQLQGEQVTVDRSGVTVSSSETGSGGSLTVTARSVELSGRLFNDEFPAGLFAQADIPGVPGGNITITARQLLVRDGALVSTTTFGEAGNGGDIIVNVSGTTELTGYSGLLATTEGIGDSGNITIDTRKLILNKGAQVNVSSFPPPDGSPVTGKTGNIEINASRSVEVRGTVPRTDIEIAQGATGLRRSGIFAQVQENATGNGGNIFVKTPLAIVREGATISTNTQSGQGGNIDIQVDALAGVNNGDISANAREAGTGGAIRITSQGIFGLQERSRQEVLERSQDFDPSELPSNDITALSATNPTLNGQVIFNTPDLDPTQGLVKLPDRPLNPDTRIALGCNADRSSPESRFINTGQGGIPPTPNDLLGGQASWEDMRPIAQGDNGRTMRRAETSRQPTLEPIIEAQGWSYKPGSNKTIVSLRRTVAHSTNPATLPANCYGR